jgi:hypothetical protein
MKISSYLIFIAFLLIYTTDSIAQSMDNQINVFTDSSTYRWTEYGTQIKFTIDNGSDSTLYFYHCAYRIACHIQKKENDSWVYVGGWGIICPAIFPSGIMSLMSDSTYSDRIYINEPGLHRLLIPAGMDKNISDSLLTNEFMVSEIITDVQYHPEVKLDNFWLSPNFPNPFNPTTHIRFSIPQKLNVQLLVTDILGHQVDMILDKTKERGIHQVSFSPKDLTSGIYFIRLTAGEFSKTQKMIYIK